MNEEQLVAEYTDIKRIIDTGKSISHRTLERLGRWMSHKHYINYKAGIRSEFEVFVPQVLQELGINDRVEVCWTNHPNFLVLLSEMVTVYENREKTLSFRMYMAPEEDPAIYGVIRDDETGELYLASCSVSYITLSERGGPVLVKKLAWRAPAIMACQCCGEVYDKALMMVFNDELDDYICNSCNKKISLITNRMPTIAEPITGYHSHRHTWRFIPQRKFPEDKHRIAFGVELEMHSTHENSQHGAQLAAQEIIRSVRGDYPNFYFEWDGSLSEGGFEMVTNPMSLHYARDWWSRMLPIIRKNCVGYSVEKHLSTQETLNYGIHLTASLKYIPRSALPKISKFFDDKRNKEFLNAIAQRAVIYGGVSLGSETSPKAKKRMHWIKGGSPVSIKTLDRRLPINIKGNLVEFRMFRSTLNTVSFMKNLEFLEALISYYSETMTQSSWHRDFLLWVSKNRKSYPNLILYLQHPVFFVKGANKVKNVWMDLVKEIKIKVNDPLKEYGPLPMYVDEADRLETSLVGA